MLLGDARWLLEQISHLSIYLQYVQHWYSVYAASDVIRLAISTVTMVADPTLGDWGDWRACTDGDNCGSNLFIRSRTCTPGLGDGGSCDSFSIVAMSSLGRPLSQTSVKRMSCVGHKYLQSAISRRFSIDLNMLQPIGCDCVVWLEVGIALQSSSNLGWHIRRGMRINGVLIPSLSNVTIHIGM